MVRKLNLRAGVIGWVAAVAVAMGLAVGSACTELRGSIGADCLKNDDCQSNVCSQQRCAPPPPLLDAAFLSDDSAADGMVGAMDSNAMTNEAGSDDSTAPADAMEAAASQKDAAADAPNVAKDAAEDGRGDALTVDASDGSVDAPAPQDGGEAG